MKQKLTEINILFEKEDYKSSLFKSLDLVKEIQDIQISKGFLTNEEDEIIKEALCIEIYSLIEMINLYASNQDNILQIAEMFASRISNVPELVDSFEAIFQRINNRFVQLLLEIHITNNDKYPKWYNFFYGEYTNIQLKLKKSMLLRVYELDPNIPHTCKNCCSYEQYYQHMEAKFFEEGVRLHNEFISLIPDFPIFHYSDTENLSSLLPNCKLSLLASFPKEDKEKEHYPSIFVPRMKEYINFFVDYLNAYTLADNGTEISLVCSYNDRKGYYNDIKKMESRIQKYESDYTHPPVDVEGYCYTDNNNTTKSGGCYVATSVYGSYDCTEVWTLRRYRDYTLAETWYGRMFIKTYYAISPTLVKWFGHTEWFKKMWRGKLDRMVAKLQANGVESTPYEDKKW